MLYFYIRKPNSNFGGSNGLAVNGTGIGIVKLRLNSWTDCIDFKWMFFEFNLGRNAAYMRQWITEICENDSVGASMTESVYDVYKKRITLTQ